MDSDVCQKNGKDSACCAEYTGEHGHGAVGRVHFSEQYDANAHNADIQIQVLNQFVVKVNLGFLQVRHKYEIEFSFASPEGIFEQFDLDNPIQPSHVRIIDLKPRPPSSSTSSSAVQPNENSQDSQLVDSSSTATVGPNGEGTQIAVTAHLYAYKEKLLKEKVMLHSKTDKTHSLTLIFYGRVLGNGKGTPFLKQGIKCIGFDLASDDEDESDFDN